MTSDHIKDVMDALAFLGAVGTFFFSTVVPALAGVCGLIWYGIRFYEYYKSKKVM